MQELELEPVTSTFLDEEGVAGGIAGVCIVVSRDLPCPSKALDGCISG